MKVFVILSINTHTSVEYFDRLSLIELDEFVREYINVTDQMKKGGG